MSFYSGGIRALHLELTNQCNAACPMCPRNEPGRFERPDLVHAELRLDDIRSMALDQTLPGLAWIVLCGNFGDPACAQDLLSIVEYLRAIQSAARLALDTNGSVHTPQWWARLGRLLSRPGDTVTFAIDGLKDTNPLYRRGTNFDRILENARSFIAAGGNAWWDFLVFRHNEHEVDAARDMAKQLGFQRFHVKRTARFLEADAIRQVYRRDGSLSHILELPHNPEYVHPAYHKAAEIAAAFGSLEALFDSCMIDCNAAAEAMIYVDCKGQAFPCCWLGAASAAGIADITALIEAHGRREALDSRRNRLDLIAAGPLFEQIRLGWVQSCASGKLMTCARTCSRQIDTYGGEIGDAPRRLTP